MRIVRYANLHSTFLLCLFRSVPLRRYAHSPFPVALNNNNNNNVDYAVASFITLFNKRDPPSQVEFDHILGSLVKINQYHTTVSLYAQMNFKTPYLINCFCHLGLMDSALSALAKTIKLGHQLDVSTYNALIDGYFLINEVNEAAKLFDSMIKAGLAPDVHSYSIMINGYCKNKMVEHAITFFKEMCPKTFVPNIGTYTLIDGLCKSGRISCVHDILDEMHESGQPPNLVAYCILLDALCKIQHLDEAIAVFHKIIDKGFRPNAYMCNILLNGLYKCGRVRTARELFEHLLANNYCLDIVTYNIMIIWLGKEGLIDEALALILKMKDRDGYLQNEEVRSVFSEGVRRLAARHRKEREIVKRKRKWKDPKFITYSPELAEAVARMRLV